MSDIQRGWLGVLASAPKCGKTHLALTNATEHDIFIFDTENGSSFIIDNSFSDHRDNINQFQIRKWNEFGNVLRALTTENSVPVDLSGKTIIIDSMTDMINFLDNEVTEERAGLREPYFAKYGHINKKIIDTLNFILDKNGTNVLLTAHLKPVYNDKGDDTGKRIPALKEKIMHLADFVGVYRAELENWDFSISRWRPMKQNWMIEPDPYDSTINQIVEGLQNPVIIDTPMPGYGFRVNPKHR